MTNAELRTVMIYYLDHMDGPGDPPTEDTVHDTILADNDGPPSSKDVYRGNVSWSLKASGNGEPKWPPKWMTLSVAELADKLVPQAATKSMAARGGTRGARRAPAQKKRAPAWFKALHTGKGGSR